MSQKEALVMSYEDEVEDFTRKIRNLENVYPYRSVEEQLELDDLLVELRVDLEKIIHENGPGIQKFEQHVDQHLEYEEKAEEDAREEYYENLARDRAEMQEEADY